MSFEMGKRLLLFQKQKCVNSIGKKKQNIIILLFINILVRILKKKKNMLVRLIFNQLKKLFSNQLNT